WFPPREKPSLGMETPSTKPQAPKKVQISNTKLQKQMAGPTARRSIFELSGHEHNYDDVRGEGFFGQTRRERRAYPTGSVRSEQRSLAEKELPPEGLRRIWPVAALLVGHRSTSGYAPSSRLAPGQIRRNERHRSYVHDHLAVRRGPGNCPVVRHRRPSLSLHLQLI